MGQYQSITEYIIDFFIELYPVEIQDPQRCTSLPDQGSSSLFISHIFYFAIELYVLALHFNVILTDFQDQKIIVLVSCTCYNTLTGAKQKNNINIALRLDSNLIKIFFSALTFAVGSSMRPSYGHHRQCSELEHFLGPTRIRQHWSLMTFSLQTRVSIDVAWTSETLQLGIAKSISRSQVSFFSFV